MNETKSIPEMLGFAPDEWGRVAAYSQLAYRARYLLYEDEADDLLKRFAPDPQTAKTAHKRIDRELSLRYIQDPEYRERVDGGYPEMERKMRRAGVIPEEEEQIKRTMNRLLGHDQESED